MFTKNKRQRGKLYIAKYLQQFKIGDRVVLKAEPSYQKSLYHHRFHGNSGVVTGKTGSCYHVEIHDGNKAKCIILHPVHLKRV